MEQQTNMNTQKKSKQTTAHKSYEEDVFCTIINDESDDISLEDYLINETQLLSRSIISNFLKLLQYEFSNISYDVLTDNNIDKLKIKEKTIFIVNPGNHWLVLTNINSKSNQKWIVYDSLNDERYLKNLKNLFNNLKSHFLLDKFLINSRNVETQIGYEDCGLFALSFAIELSLGNDPSLIKFKQNSM